jgi:hypothetical protein
LTGTNKSVFQILDRCQRNGKKFKFLKPDITLEGIYAARDNKDHLYRQFNRGGGAVSFDRDFSYGSYEFEFVD